MRERKEYDIVFLSTEDVITPLTQKKLVLFSQMMDYYTRNYYCHFILFSNSSSVIDLFSNSSHTVISSYSRNPYGLPIVSSLLIRALNQFKARYYGYLNADILLHPDLFAVLSYLHNQSRLGLLSEEHELVGRVYNARMSLLPDRFSNQTQMLSVYSIPLKEKLSLRGSHSSLSR